MKLRTINERINLQNWIVIWQLLCLLAIIAGKSNSIEWAKIFEQKFDAGHNLNDIFISAH